ncbi:MAG: large-conductance mechanosensitive channel protein MscL [Candidatus Eremiobacteraeota bacterium]|nr:large-conductance mechanosensitive channel protein MscL [Candidatus Eremiobacteraeota bacterium]
MSFFSEFKEFATKGNVVDMAVGVIIGGAFGKIVTSLVNDLVMPPIGLLIGGVNFKDLSIVLKPGAGDVPPVALKYGLFINTILEFLIIALAIFSVIHIMNSLKRQKEEAPAPPPAPSTEEALLGEIRDILKQKA